MKKNLKIKKSYKKIEENLYLKYNHLHMKIHKFKNQKFRTSHHQAA